MLIAIQIIGAAVCFTAAFVAWERRSPGRRIGLCLGSAWLMLAMFTIAFS